MQHRVKREAEQEDRASIAANFYGQLSGNSGTPHSIATCAATSTAIIRAKTTFANQ
jgi:hypothetical protein